MSGTATPDRLGKFEIKGVLGKGAMGTVYDGWDPHIGRRVAIKTVRMQYDETDEEAVEAVARFKREAQAAGRLSHENIVGVFDYGETDEIAFIVMEFVEGTSLKALVDPGQPVAPARAGELMLQVLAGLEFSHRRGIVHRDIKPANVMLTLEGKVKLADFGIAKIASSNMTSVGVILGTPAYMPPEQFLGDPADARSDIYAAGAMLFHLLTGKRPYEGNPTSIMQRVLNAPAPPLPSERVTGLGVAWDSVIKKAMARQPADRFQTAAEFGDAVSAALRAPLAPVEEHDAEATIIQSAPKRGAEHPPALKPAAKPVAKPVPAVTGAKKSSPLPLIIGGVLVVVAVAGAGAWFALKPSTPSVPTPTQAPSLPPPAPAAVSTPAPVAAAPSPAALLASLSAKTQNLPCTYLDASLNGDALALSGIAGTTQQAAVFQAAGNVTPSLQSIPQTYCGAIDVLRPLMRTSKLNFTVPEATGPVTSTMHLHPTISALPFGAWLQVDYLSGDGTVVHLLPSTGGGSGFPNIAAKFVAANGSITLGDATFPVVPGPPYGTDMVIAIASSHPLNTGTRTQGESTATYLAALQSAIDQARAAGTQIAAGVVVLETKEK